MMVRDFAVHTSLSAQFYSFLSFAPANTARTDDHDLIIHGEYADACRHTFLGHCDGDRWLSGVVASLIAS